MMFLFDWDSMVLMSSLLDNAIKENPNNKELKSLRKYLEYRKDDYLKYIKNKK